MPKHRRQFSDEFKAEVVKLCEVGDRSRAQVARDLGLDESLVLKWVKNAKSAQSPNSLNHVEFENRSTGGVSLCA